MWKARGRSSFFNRIVGNSVPAPVMPSNNRLAYWKRSGIVPLTGVSTRWNEFTGNGYDWIADTGIEPGYDSSLGCFGDGTMNMTLTTPLNLSYTYTCYFLIKLNSYNSQLLAGNAVDEVVLFYDNFNSWVSTYLPGTGAYQFNITMPDVPFDELAVVALTVYNSATPAKTFLNGVQLGDFNNTNLGVGNSTISRLMGNQSDVGTDVWFHGYWAALAIYNVNHTPAEIVTNSQILLTDGLT